LVFPSDPEYSHFSSIITKGSKYTVNSFWGWCIMFIERIVNAR
jgi:hypothetical protein